MKKSSCAIEFFIIFVLFVLPPLLVSTHAAETRVAIYPLSVFCNAACMALLLFFHNCASARPSFSKRIMETGTTLITFGVLCTVSALLQLLLFLLGRNVTTIRLLPPRSFWEWANCIAGTLAAAFFEEALFRWYLPDALKKLLPQKLHAGSECAVVLLFALSHRYLGLAGMSNALLSGIALRRCAIRTGGIKSSWCAHAAYNALALLFSFLG